ncbi:MAG: HD domain-containing protein [Sphaerochaetaceae bacterium]|jgi:dGTPase|nr:HD domain-containing protein [Sphaerochaetaceae bacterium]
MTKFENYLPMNMLQSRLKERTEDIRGSYYRDTTAIIHCSAFRRLKHKTQVFFAPSNDHICTRIEHSLHVASIASAICRGLGLDNELAWAIGMGHDLGHTPFGHTGEHIIDAMMKEEGLSGFEHEANSLRVVQCLYPLNLTYAVRDGIVCHCGEHFIQSIRPQEGFKDLSVLGSRKKELPSTWEGCVVRFSDQIAYLGRDFEDAVRLNLIDRGDLSPEIRKVLGSTNGEIINTLVYDIIDHSSPEKGISFSEPVFEAVHDMKDFNYRRIYHSTLLSSYMGYFNRLIRLVVGYIEGLYDRFGTQKEGYEGEKNMLAASFYSHMIEKKASYEARGESLKQMIFDYVSGMTDNFCLDCANEILKPEHLNEALEGFRSGKLFD